MNTPPNTVQLGATDEIGKFIKFMRAEEEAAAAMNHSMARVQAVFSDTEAAMEQISKVAKEAAASMGGSIDDFKEVLEQLQLEAQRGYILKQWRRFGETPDQELNRRLNMRMRGEDPGPPINWKGLPR